MMSLLSDQGDGDDQTFFMNNGGGFLNHKVHTNTHARSRIHTHTHTHTTC